MNKISKLFRQAHLSFGNDDLIVIDRLHDLPTATNYYSEYVLVIICTAGKVQMSYDSRGVTIHKDQLFLGIPGSTIADYMFSPDFDCKLLACKPSEASTPHEPMGQVLNSALYVKDHPVVTLNQSDHEALFGYYHLLCNRLQHAELRYHNSEVRALLSAFLLNVIGIMDRDMEVPDSNTTVRGEQLVERFLILVNEDNGQHRFVEYYAERLHITAKYLSTLVRNSLDRTPTDIISAVTIKEIGRRLRFNQESIKEISCAMNFPNTSFFGKYFKHHVGMTPMSYRNKYRK
ncbi:MAG: helix-turn-helix domain-containing protein [Prevotella sp.]|nr:helix-turn-helix domain-containing protein [Prevotella sp.]